MLTAKYLPQEDPVEAAFKAPDQLHHTYAPPKPPTSSTLGPPVQLRLPKALQGLSRSVEGHEQAMGSSGSLSPISYQKVRRWDMLPKHAWLQAAESGQAPGPGFRDVSSTQTLRSYGPKGVLPSVPTEGALQEKGMPEGRQGLSGVIGQHYTPRAKGLAPASLNQMLKEGLPEPEEADAVEDAPTESLQVVPILQECRAGHGTKCLRSYMCAYMCAYLSVWLYVRDCMCARVRARTHLVYFHVFLCGLRTCARRTKWQPPPPPSCLWSSLTRSPLPPPPSEHTHSVALTPPPTLHPSTDRPSPPQNTHTPLTDPLADGHGISP